MASLPPWAISSSSSSRLSALRAARPTWAPAAASALAVARPMPEDAPVTSATRPARGVPPIPVRPALSRSALLISCSFSSRSLPREAYANHPSAWKVEFCELRLFRVFGSSAEPRPATWSIRDGAWAILYEAQTLVCRKDIHDRAYLSVLQAVSGRGYAGCLDGCFQGYWG